MKERDIKCLVLAGGLGTRLYPLTINRAKSLLEYEGKPLLTHIVNKIPHDMAVLIATNKRFETEFLRWREGIDKQVEICYEDACSDEQKKGAVGALQFWVVNKQINQDLLVIAGDNYFGFNLEEFIAAYDSEKALVAVHDISDKRKAAQFGVVKLEGDRIVRFEEKPANPESALVATAIYIFPPRLFPILAHYCARGQTDDLGSFISYLVNVDEVKAYVFAEAWFDIGSQLG